MSSKYPGGIISKTAPTPSGAYENSTASGIWTLEQQAYWQKLGQWPTAGNVQPDAQFNYVTMLLHGDGTNGAQNNTFLDGSTNNSTITRNGNTTQGSFSPYGSNWSNFFDGSSALNVADNAVFTLPADFTIECWFFQTGAFQDRLIISKWPTEYYIYTRADGVIGLAWGPYNASGMFGIGGVVQSGNNGFALNTWTHVAAVRNSNTFTLYINGVSVSTTTFSTGGTDGSSGVTIGDYGSGGYAFEGYISNARIVKGTAVYTANFTPSTTPLTAITNTSLLTCADNRFVDDSTNNFTITPTATSVQRFNPFGASAAYSTSVIGGSGYFDGSGDYLSVPNPQSFAPGTGDWTIECWLYPISGDWAIIAGSNFYINNNSGIVYVGDASVDIISVSPPTTNTWTHIATTKSGSTVRLFYNGTQVGSSTTAMSTSTTTSMVVGGRPSSSISTNGYMGGFRMVVGTAVYTSTFTPPSSPPTAITNTSLLLNYTNGAIFNNAMMNDLETVADAKISTSVVKYGTGSLSFDGTGDRLFIKDVTNLGFGTGDFTVELWVYFNVSPADTGFVGSVGSGGMDFVYHSSGSLRIGQLAVGWDSIFSPFTPATGTWYHIAFTRSGTTARGFVDGVQIGSNSTNTVSYAPTGGMNIGASNSTGARHLNGYIDDLRITKGYARYTANFTPPTAAFPNIGPT
jgi:hypothetical protein